MKRNRKWKIPHTVLERRTLCFSLYKNCKLKIKLWWVGARERKKRSFFVPFISFEGNFLQDLCFISMYSVLNTHSEYTYQKTLLHTLLLLVFKILESLQCILKDSFSKCEQIHSFLETADLVTFTEKILKSKLHFLCSVVYKSVVLYKNFYQLRKTGFKKQMCSNIIWLMYFKDHFMEWIPLEQSRYVLDAILNHNLVHGASL